MCRAGFLPVSEPLFGDVGVVEAMTPIGIRPGAAIFTGKLWAGLATEGLIFAPFPVLAAWRV
jgi:hypothetical protein